MTTRCVCGHDCVVERCEGPALRAHIARIDQGLGHVGHPIGDTAADARLAAAYRTTAAVLDAAARRTIDAREVEAVAS